MNSPFCSCQFISSMGSFSMWKRSWQQRICIINRAFCDWNRRQLDWIGLDIIYQLKFIWNLRKRKIPMKSWNQKMEKRNTVFSVFCVCYHYLFLKNSTWYKLLLFNLIFLIFFKFKFFLFFSLLIRKRVEIKMVNKYKKTMILDWNFEFFVSLSQRAKNEIYLRK